MVRWGIGRRASSMSTERDGSAIGQVVMGVKSSYGVAGKDRS
jgi:hypothetical protein